MSKPNCQCDGEQYVNVGRQQWGYCDACKLCWLIGDNVYSSWRDETEADWAWSIAHLDGYAVLSTSVESEENYPGRGTPPADEEIEF